MRVAGRIGQNVVYHSHKGRPNFNVELLAISPAELRTRANDLNWIDAHHTIQVDEIFCEFVASCYGTKSPITNSPVRVDRNSHIGLYKWNPSFANALFARDSEEFEAIVWELENTSPAACRTWMTKKDAWRLWIFLADARRSHRQVLEIRVLQ